MHRGCATYHPFAGTRLPLVRLPTKLYHSQVGLAFEIGQCGVRITLLRKEQLPLGKLFSRVPLFNWDQVNCRCEGLLMAI